MPTGALLTAITSVSRSVSQVLMQIECHVYLLMSLYIYLCRMVLRITIMKDFENAILNVCNLTRAAEWRCASVWRTTTVCAWAKHKLGQKYRFSAKTKQQKTWKPKPEALWALVYTAGCFNLCLVCCTWSFWNATWSRKSENGADNC